MFLSGKTVDGAGASVCISHPLLILFTHNKQSMKVRRGGVGSHFCIHRYFFERNPSWKAIRDEETQAENLQVKIQHPEVDFMQEDFDVEDPNSLNFTPIDARHLSSLPLISGRVIRLLKASKNHMHASNNMLITLVRQ